MALVERIFYTLPELTKRWGKSEDELIHMAAAGDLLLSISYEGYISGLPVWSCQGFLTIYPHDAAKFLLGNKPVVEISRFYDPDCSPSSSRKHCSPITLPENCENLEEAVQSAEPTKLKIARTDLVVMARAVIRLEAAQPELLARRNPDDFIPYPKAMKILRRKWQATPEELAAWVFLGPDSGGIAAYQNANELNPAPRFFFDYSMGEDYLLPLMACWFLEDDIEQFEPDERYITGAALIERWRKQPDLHPEAFIRAKIAESRLLDMHPTFGGTDSIFGEDNGHFPPLSAGLFAVSHVEQIEADDGLVFATALTKTKAEPSAGGAPNKGGRRQGPLAEAVEMAYLHFRDKGDVFILQPGNIRSFLKNFGTLAKDDVPLEELGKRNIYNAISELIKEVKIPRAGKCFITTRDREEGNKINPGRRYGQEEIAKLLTRMREKYPLPS